MGWHKLGYANQAINFQNKKTGTSIRFFYFNDLAFYFKKPFSAKKAILIFDSVFCSAALSPSNKRSI